MRMVFSKPAPRVAHRSRSPRRPVLSRSRPSLRGLFAAAAAWLGLAGCGGGDSPAPAPTPAPTVIASATVSAVRTGGATTVVVDAFNSAGTREDFSFTSTDPYATVVNQGNGVLQVTGQSVGRQRINVTSASGATQAIDVDVYDPMTMDIGGGLMMKYVNTYERRWTNLSIGIFGPAGRAGDHEMQAAHPRPGGADWHALGSYMRHGYADVGTVRDYAMIVLKDVSAAQDRLRAPTGYAKVWTSQGAIFLTPGSVWNPICPTGYVAMGMVAVAGLTAPPLDDVRCVNAQNTVPGKVGEWVIDDVGSRADTDVTWYQSVRPDNRLPDDGVAFMPAGTMVAAPVARSSNNPGAVDPATLNVLVVNLPQVRTGSSTDYEPKLSGYAPFQPRVSRSQSAVRVPFQLVGDADPAHTLDWRVTNSPFYTIVREEVYVSGNAVDNRQATNPTSMTYQTEFGWSQTDYAKFSRELGIEVTTGGSFKFVSAEVKLSLKLAWEQSTSTTYSTVTTNTYQWTVPAGVFAQVLHVTSQMRVLTENGIDAGVLPMKSNILKYVQYPLQ